MHYDITKPIITKREITKAKTIVCYSLYRQSTENRTTYNVESG